MKKSVCILLLGSLIFTGCSSITKSSFTGAGTGMAVGAASGHTFAGKDKGKAALYGALTMGLIGGITGIFTHKQLEKRDERVRKETLFNLDKFDVSSPYNHGSGNYTNGDNSKQILIFTDDSKLLRQLKGK